MKCKFDSTKSEKYKGMMDLVSEIAAERVKVP